MRRDLKFQSPSRGGHLRGAAPTGPSAAQAARVSVPFTRGTPPWHAERRKSKPARCMFQSPSRGGHLRGARPADYAGPTASVSVPFTRGTPPWRMPLAAARSKFPTVSVPFTRGTPPWLLGAMQAGRAVLQVFQSPSRGGHLRGRYPPETSGHARRSVSVPFTRGTPPWRGYQRCRRSRAMRFSPLHEGDTSVAPGACGWQPRACITVSVPFTRGTPPWRAADLQRGARQRLVSVPFTRGTPPWRSTA